MQTQLLVPSWEHCLQLSPQQHSEQQQWQQQQSHQQQPPPQQQPQQQQAQQQQPLQQVDEGTAACVAGHLRVNSSLRVHCFTPSLTHAQRMSTGLCRSSSSSSSGGGIITSSSDNDAGAFEKSNSRSSSSDSGWSVVEALERTFHDGPQESTQKAAGSPSCSTGLSGGQHFEIQLHLAEWACASQQSRAVALGFQREFSLTDEMQFAELCGVSESRAVLDGVAW